MAASGVRRSCETELRRELAKLLSLYPYLGRVSLLGQQAAIEGEGHLVSEGL